MLNKLKLKPARALAAGLALLIVPLAGCRSLKTYPDFQFQIAEAALADGPPQPTGGGIRSTGEVSSHPETLTDVTTATGYENLSESVKHLYGPEPLAVSLADITRQTLSHNRSIRIEGYTLNAAQAQIPISKSIYDLVFEGSAEVSKSKVQTASALSAAVRRERDYGISASQLLPTGATVSIGYTYNRLSQIFFFSTINPTITQAFTAQVRQPLLQGFGPKITNIDIHIAQLDAEASVANFETEILDQVSESLQAYWDLVFAVKSYDVKVISMLAAMDLLRINTAKVKAGVMAPTDELQARARVEERREFVIRARQAVRDAEDLLKRLVLFQDYSPAWDLELLPTQELTWREIEIDREQLIAAAMLDRPEIRAQLRRVYRRELEVEKAKDARKPQLDVIGSARFSGLDSDGTKAFEFATTFDFQNFILGMEFRFPFQNRAARFAQSQAIARLGGEAERLEDIKDQVMFELRQAFRELKTSRERIEITHSRVESEQANLNAEKKRFDVGISTSFQVLEFQEDLAEAEEAYIRAIADYNKAEIALERARGTLLGTYGVIVESPALDPESERVLFPIGFE